MTAGNSFLTDNDYIDASFNAEYLQQIKEFGNKHTDQVVISNASNQDNGIQQNSWCFLYRSKESNYPDNWQNISISNGIISNVYGVVFHFKGQQLFIYTRFGIKTFMAEYLQEDHCVIGCWLLLQLTNEKDDALKQICSKPEVLDYPFPLNTRLFKNQSSHFLLFYDTVQIIDQFEAHSKFFGRINSKVLLERNYDDDEPSDFCNVEYSLKCSEANNIIKYRCKIVKYHGSIYAFTDLPNVLSYKPGYSLPLKLASRYCFDALYSQEEKDNFFEQQREALLRQDDERQRQEDEDANLIQYF